MQSYIEKDREDTGPEPSRDYSHVMGPISTGPEIISVTGCTSQTVELLDMSPFGQYSVQSPPRFEECI